MNNSFKKSSLLLILFFSLYSVIYCQERRKPQRTVEDLAKIATKHGMQDMMPSLKNTTLLYDDIAKVEQYFETTSTSRKMGLQYNEFKKKAANIRTHKEYFDLMEKYPLVKNAFMVAHKWDDKSYAEYVNKVAKYKWRIYVDKSGSLSFYKGDAKITKAELAQGRRIDNLPRE
ncbi:MAG: hypothetical protein U5L45_00175 [Saprospiraceae bacterium]|nr:hypothetical protein [Saprospiraceae bacterium]